MQRPLRDTLILKILGFIGIIKILLSRFKLLRLIYKTAFIHYKIN